METLDQAIVFMRDLLAVREVTSIWGKRGLMIVAGPVVLAQSTNCASSTFETCVVRFWWPRAH